MKGKPKAVGRTARGTTAKTGTVAADPKVFPFGTRLEIPGYGTGVVEDVGGSIKGRHIDVWFPTHEEAVRWGRRELAVKRLK
jgi:3D (Asp-Asp-Asp) domain-containing protein